MSQKPEALPGGPPRGADEAAFRAPWEAQAFALAVQLHEAGHFTWTEWAAALSETIAAAQAAGDPDLGDSYYRHWLAALEHLLRAKGLVDPATLERRQAAWAEAHRRTPHGQPVTLGGER